MPISLSHCIEWLRGSRVVQLCVTSHAVACQLASVLRELPLRNLYQEWDKALIMLQLARFGSDESCKGAINWLGCERRSDLAFCCESASRCPAVSCSRGLEVTQNTIQAHKASKQEVVTGLLRQSNAWKFPRYILRLARVSEQFMKGIRLLR